ncbi:MAG: ATP-binding protein [Ignavibacteria bacterium]|nr:ATP-binding protein [Ignavibacteria bacterium]
MEFKSATEDHSFEKIGKYFSALSNEANLKNQDFGWLVFGVNDCHNIVGTNYRNNPNSLHSLKQDIALHINNNITFIEIHELNLPEGRVILFQIPRAKQGIPISWKGHFYGRDGESLVPLNPVEFDQIRNQSRILDYSAQICNDASLNDLSDIAISIFRSLWFEKSNNRNILNCSREQLLSDAEFLIDNKLNYAAIILLGTKEALSRYLPNAEIIFEYRNSETDIRNQFRENYKIGFLGILDKLWDLINARNGMDHLQEKFVFKDIPYFNKEVIREAILNAVCHRDYQSPVSVFIRQFPKSISIENPGGFPNGITSENILYRTNPRNRRIAEAFEKCGLVERSGQGADEMFRKLIEESKPLPDYSRSDNFNVILKINGEIQDKNFIQFIQRLYKERNPELSIEQLLTLDEIRRSTLKIENRQAAIDQLLQQEIISKKNLKGVISYSLSNEFYPGEKTFGKSKKQIGLEKQEAALIQFLSKHHKVSLSDLMELFSLSDRNKIYNILRPLKKEGLIEFVGDKKTGYWKLSE